MKLPKSLFLINVLVSLAVLIFAWFTKSQLILYSPPYGLEQHTVSFIVQGMMFFDVESKAMIRQLFELVAEENLVLVFESPDQMGLGVYDPRHKYTFTAEFPEAQEQFERGEGIYIRSDSYYSTAQTVPNIQGDPMRVLGRYDSTSPLYHEKYEYVYPYFWGSGLMGTYHIESPSDTVAMEFIELLHRNGQYLISFSQSYPQKPLEQISLALQNLAYVMCVVGIILIFINLFVYYLVILSKLKKPFSIHWIYGGTPWGLIRRQIPSFFSTITLAFTAAVLLLLWCGGMPADALARPFGYWVPFVGYAVVQMTLFVLALFGITQKMLQTN